MRPPRPTWLLLALLTAVSFALPCAAQVRPELERPALPEIPEQAPREAPFILPPVPPAPSPERGRLGAAPRVRVESFRFEGNTVFDDETLAALLADYTGRQLTAEELHAARDVVTRHYIAEGFINSGAVIPDQSVEDGTLELRIVEGELTEVRIEGNTWLSERYLEPRVRRHAEGVLDVNELERGLQRLQRSSRVRRVKAHLGPGARPGEGILQLGVEENRPYHLVLEGSNFEAPSIGAWRGRLDFWHESLTRNADALRVSYRRSEGLDDFSIEYRYPILADDTTLIASYRWGESEVVEKPFDAIDIESKSRTYRIGVERPFYRSLRSEVVLGIEAELHRTQTYLLDRRFSFAPGVVDGKSEVALFRLRQDWVFRDREQVIATRSQLTIGTDLLGANTSDFRTPDGRFFAWLAQFQWARRFDWWWGTELLFRVDAQITSSPLLSLEQFAIGGHGSVRGYRENQIVRDNGVVTSVEARIPAWRESDGRPIVQLIPFFDWGYGWNEKRPTPQVRTLYSTGVGFRWAITRSLMFSAYWAADLRRLTVFTQRDVQDTGFHASLVWRVF